MRYHNNMSESSGPGGLPNPLDPLSSNNNNLFSIYKLNIFPFGGAKNGQLQVLAVAVNCGFLLC
uniref:Uncharacterized protein n=1 Tax=Rhizophora mucronata TaxID=61149 RepID=A0A2P2IQ82_RHIMU